MTNRKSNILVLIVLLLGISQASTGAAFLRNGNAPRSEAMGGAFTAVADDLDAFYYNPAGYAFQTDGRFNSYFSRVDNEQNVFYFGAGENLAKNTYFAVNMITSSLAGIPLTTYSGGKVIDSGSSFDYSASALNLAGAYAVSKKLAFGMNFKIIQESLYENSASGSGLDIGVLYKYSDVLNIGYSALNIIAPVMVWDTESGNEDTVYGDNRFGISYVLDDDLMVAYDLSIGVDNISNHLGMEYFVNELFSLRVGMAEAAYYVGMGMVVDSFHFDYSYGDEYDSLVESTHKIALGYSWGGSSTSSIKNSQKPVVAVQSKESIQAELEVAFETEKVDLPKEVAIESKPFDFDEVVSQDFSKVSLSNFLISQKRSFVKNGNKLKCFYRFENKSNKDMKIKISTKILDSKKNILVGEKSLVAIFPAGKLDTFPLVATLKKQATRYKIKTYIKINNQETIEFVDYK